MEQGGPGAKGNFGGQGCPYKTRVRGLAVTINPQQRPRNQAARRPRAMGKPTHDALERFVQDVLCKREPCPAMVLAWGWCLKQVRF